MYTYIHIIKIHVIHTQTHTHTHTHTDKDTNEQIHTQDTDTDTYTVTVTVRYRHLLVEAERRLVCPAARNVADGVPAPAHNHQRLAEALHELNTLAVALYGQVEGPEAVAY